MPAEIHLFIPLQNIKIIEQIVKASNTKKSANTIQILWVIRIKFLSVHGQTFLRSRPDFSALMDRFMCVLDQTFVLSWHRFQRSWPDFHAFTGRRSCVHGQTFPAFMARLSFVPDQSVVRSWPDIRAFMIRLSCVPDQIFLRSWPNFRVFIARI